MGVSFNAAFYTLHICNNYSYYEFNNFLKFENILLLHSIQFDKCLLGTGYHGATGNAKPKETSSLMSFFL